MPSSRLAASSPTVYLHLEIIESCLPFRTMGCQNWLSLASAIYCCVLLSFKLSFDTLSLLGSSLCEKRLFSLFDEEFIGFLLEDRQVIIDLTLLVLVSSLVNYDDLIVFVDHSCILLVYALLIWRLSIAQTESVFLLLKCTIIDSSFVEVLRDICWLKICTRKACILWTISLCAHVITTCLLLPIDGQSDLLG